MRTLFQTLVQESCRLAQSSGDVDRILEQTVEVYDAYDRFYTMLALADIRYCLDLSDSYYQEEYAYCTGQSAQVDQGLETYYRALADSPAAAELEPYFGEGFFDGYTGESLWDEELVDLMNRESEVLARYYEAMDGLSGADYEQMEQTLGPMLVELIGLRESMAAKAGYDSCEAFLWDGTTAGITPLQIWRGICRRFRRSWSPCTGRSMNPACTTRFTATGTGRASVWTICPPPPGPWAERFCRPMRR